MKRNTNIRVLVDVPMTTSSSKPRYSMMVCRIQGRSTSSFTFFMSTFLEKLVGNLIFLISFFCLSLKRPSWV